MFSLHQRKYIFYCNFWSAFWRFNVSEKFALSSQDICHKTRIDTKHTFLSLPLYTLQSSFIDIANESSVWRHRLFLLLKIRDVLSPEYFACRVRLVSMTFTTVKVSIIVRLLVTFYSNVKTNYIKRKDFISSFEMKREREWKREKKERKKEKITRIKARNVSTHFGDISRSESDEFKGFRKYEI